MPLTKLILQRMIRDAEWRIGNHMTSKSAKKEDVYVQKQIKLIKQWNEEIEKI